MGEVIENFFLDDLVACIAENRGYPEVPLKIIKNATASIQKDFETTKEGRESYMIALSQLSKWAAKTFPAGLDNNQGTFVKWDFDDGLPNELFIKYRIYTIKENE